MRSPIPAASAAWPLLPSCRHTQLTPAVVGRLGDFQNTADIGNGLALDDQLICSCELADDLLRRVTGSFHGGVPDPVWPDADSHSP